MLGSPQNPDGPQVPTGPVPEPPPLRLFLVQRFRADQGGDEAPELEVVQVQAHVVNLSENGALIFSEYVIDPLEGPVQRVRMGFNDWYDFAEQFTPKSAIIQ